jgi:cytochrome P450
MTLPQQQSGVGGGAQDRPGPAGPLPPGPSAATSVLWTKRLQTDPLPMFERLAQDYGDVARLRLGRHNVVALRGAEAARRVLVTGQDVYAKGRSFRLFRPLLGMGLVTSEGAQWANSRRAVQPLFAGRHLGRYAEHIGQAAVDALRTWDESWADGERIAMDEVMLHVGLDTVGRALIGEDLTRDARKLGTAMSEALLAISVLNGNLAVTAAQMLFGWDERTASRVVNPRQWRKLDHNAAFIRSTIEALVARREREGQRGRDDLLRLLMETDAPEHGGSLSRVQVVDELRTFVGAGHETTAHGLTWMFHLLAATPDALARVEQEVDEVIGDRVPTLEDTERLPYLTACFLEALRLYPPAWILPRRAVTDDVVGGFLVPKGSDVLFSVWATHRDPGVYPDPSRFDPERWLPHAAPRPRYSFLPFGAGRRACVGQGFAMLNARILAALMIRRYRFAAVPGRPVELLTSITLRAADGVPMRAYRR